MNRLCLTRCYLCGAMDRAADAGEGWRRRIRRVLADLEIHWLDPTRKPIDIGVEDDASRQRRREMKANNDYGYVTAEMKPIRCVDLRMVDFSDFLVVHLDLDVHACGTYEELFWANRMKRPIFLHCEQGKNAVPDWLFATLPHDYFHSTWDGLFAHIRYVAQNPKFVDYSGRWYFFDWMGS